MNELLNEKVYLVINQTIIVQDKFGKDKILNRQQYINFILYNVVTTMFPGVDPYVHWGEQEESFHDRVSKKASLEFDLRYLEQNIGKNNES